jgi:hypothetical protein
MKNKKGSNALGLVGIIVTVILFELIFSIFYAQITAQNIQNLYVSKCDCGVIGCSVFLAQNGANELFDNCRNQMLTNPDFHDSVMNIFWNSALVIAIIVCLNIILIICVVLILRGVPA